MATSVEAANMTKRLFFLCGALSCLCAIRLGAQDKPLLTGINFLVSGQSVETTSNGDVTVELTFDKPMDQTLNPVVKFGLSGPFDLTVPEGQGWISGTLWQGFFTVSDNNPQTGDGKYIFQVYGAKDANHVEMDTTLSTIPGLDKFLFICRSGELDLSQISLDFGSIRSGSSTQLSVTINNNSCAELNISSVSVPAPFSLRNTPSRFTIPGESSRTLTVVYSPIARASHAATLTIVSDDRHQSTHTVQLIGSAHGPQIVLTPGSLLSFGKVEVGFSVAKTVVVTNKAALGSSLSDTLHISSIRTDGSIYTVSPTTVSIPPDSSESLEVRFTPSEHRAYNGFILSFRSDDLMQPLRTIVLNGDASDEVPPPPLSNLSVSWDGFGGFTNAANLAICWDNPEDPSGIAEIWWKFVTTPTPPQSATDTTSAGGRFIIPTGASCASLPLFGRLSTGFWYCYLWLVDGNGNSGYAKAVQTSFVYDISPPGIPTVLSRTINAARWFGANANFELTLGIPADPFRGVKDASEVRWKYQTPPTSADAFDDRYLIQASDPPDITITVVFDSEELCGDDSLFVWLADSAGNVSADSATFARYRFDICRPQIRRLLPEDDNIAELGQAFLDTLVITDDSKIDTAWVRYRFGGANAEEPPRKLTRIAESDSFIVEIPGAGVTRRGVEFRVIAVDSLGNEGNGPTQPELCDTGNDDQHWFPVRTRVPADFRIDKDGRPVPLIFGEDAADYQLLSIPYDLDTTDVMQVLQDDLGTYDKTMWRLFDYKTDNPEASRFLEGSEARAFTAGRSFFIITRQENIVVDSGPGVTRQTVCKDSMRVYPGWNLIASPFNFPVGRESLSLRNSNSVVTLRSFERGWNIVDVMDPWKGYALFVTKPADQSDETPIYLLVEPKAVSGRVAKAASDYFALPQGDWLIQISARAGKVHDLENWAGVQTQALAGFDDLELAEPLVIGKYLSVSFPHPEWNLPANNFSTDIRPADSREQVWEFEIETNLVSSRVNLSFDFLGDFPNDTEVHLIDQDLKLAQNLHVNAHYSFKSGKSGSKKKFKLIVGSVPFATLQAGDIGLVPETFELLQNFPNPFNPETRIRYNLAEATKVTFEIFDLLGRKVNTLAKNEQQEAGYYTVTWNGRDRHGKPLASGVYIYRITTNSQSISRKMILMK